MSSMLTDSEWDYAGAISRQIGEFNHGICAHLDAELFATCILQDERDYNAKQYHALIEYDNHMRLAILHARQAQTALSTLIEEHNK